MGEFGWALAFLIIAAVFALWFEPSATGEKLGEFVAAFDAARNAE